MNTKLGRIHVAEPLEVLLRLHQHDGVSKLTTVDHEPKVGVLDQEDLLTQGIDVSTFIPVAPKGVTALGSCTCNTLTEAFSNILTEPEFAEFVAKMGSTYAESADTVYTDVVSAERAAIGTYHAVTDQTKRAATEWPPTDCGSSGIDLYEWAIAQKYIGREEVAVGAQNIVSAMQGDGTLRGTPWFNAWFEPDAQGFIDGNGSATALEAAIKSGVAGGHEIYDSAIEKLEVTATGKVIPEKTVIRFRNHWTPSWGDHGSGRIHLSTIVWLGSHIDIRRFYVVGA